LQHVGGIAQKNFSTSKNIGTERLWTYTFFHKRAVAQHAVLTARSLAACKLDCFAALKKYIVRFSR
jgi:hypothetical protein